MNYNKNNNLENITTSITQSNNSVTRIDTTDTNKSIQQSNNSVTTIDTTDTTKSITQNNNLVTTIDRNFLNDNQYIQDKLNILSKSIRCARNIMDTHINIPTIVVRHYSNEKETSAKSRVVYYKQLVSLLLNRELKEVIDTNFILSFKKCKEFNNITVRWIFQEWLAVYYRKEYKDFKNFIDYKVFYKDLYDKNEELSGLIKLLSSVSLEQSELYENNDTEPNPIVNTMLINRKILNTINRILEDVNEKINIMLNRTYR
jgi:hypothetical protein